jgi:hypothetical protein
MDMRVLARHDLEKSELRRLIVTNHEHSHLHYSGSLPGRSILYASSQY